MTPVLPIRRRPHFCQPADIIKARFRFAVRVYHRRRLIPGLAKVTALTRFNLNPRESCDSLGSQSHPEI